MVDTKHSPAEIPVEGDGVNYRGIVWFIVVLVVTVLACQVLIWALFRLTETYRLARPEIVRAPLADPVAEPAIENGQIQTGLDAPGPQLLVHEPTVLGQFRTREDEILQSPGWVNQGAQVVRLPIDRAKELLLERGIPTAGAAGTEGTEGTQGTPGTAGTAGTAGAGR